ncbi:hypothetical protein LguiA_019111 [Lonicera macranthoides]
MLNVDGQKCSKQCPSLAHSLPPVSLSQPLNSCPLSPTSSTTISPSPPPPPDSPIISFRGVPFSSSSFFFAGAIVKQI